MINEEVNKPSQKKLKVSNYEFPDVGLVLGWFKILRWFGYLDLKN
jgi:hypothetical protein